MTTTMQKSRSEATEFVAVGHPDKVCDQIADAILDTAMDQDPYSRVAMEVTGGHGIVAVFGEMTTSAHFDIGEIVRSTYIQIGYEREIGVVVNVVKQHPEIEKLINEERCLEANQGAGDQGIMTGYAVVGETNLMPRSWNLARALCEKMRKLRENRKLSYLGPDGKSMVILNGDRVVHVTLAVQHTKGIKRSRIKEDLITLVVEPVVGEISPRHVVVNGKKGTFVQGGFDADSGTTGRKLMIDNYGPNVEVGGGCYSGKDPSKVDRSAAYFCRFVAKSIVASGCASEALVKVGYSIGLAKPHFVSVETSLPENKTFILERKVYDAFDFRPGAIIECLGLLKREGWRYRDTAVAGHFGDERFPWERPVAI